MKKLLLSMATVALGLLGANASTVTFDFTEAEAIQKMNPDVILPTEASTGTNVNNVTFSLEGINITGTPGTTEARIWKTTGNAFQYRLYKNATMTVASDKTITEIKINSNASGSFSATGYSSGTWSGSSSSVEFSVSGTVQISSITVTYDENSTGGGDNPGGGDEPVDPNPGGETQTATYVPKNMGYANQQAITSATVDAIEFTFDKGSNNSNPPTYYTSGNALRLYGGNTMTISCAGGTMTKIEFTFDSGETAGKEMTSNLGTFSNTTWTGSSDEVVFTVASGSGHRRIASVTVYYTSTSGKKAAGLSFPESAYTVKFGASFDSPKATSANGSDGVITYVSSDPAVATVNENTGVVNVLAVGTTTITASITETDAFASGTANYTLNVTPATVWTVAEALAAIEDGYNGTAQVQGYITKIDEVSTGFGNATYYIADEKGGSPELEVFRGYWLNGEKFTSEDQIAVDGLITVEGTLVNYNGTYEFTTGSKVVEYVAPEGGGDEPVDPNPPVEDNALYTLTFGAENNQSTVSNYTSTWNVISNNFEWTIENFNNNNTGLKNGTPTGEWDYARCGRKENASVAKIITDFPVEDKKHVQNIVINGILNAANQTGLNKAYIEVYNTNPSADGATAIETVEIPEDTFIGAKGNKIDYTAELTNTDSGLYYVIVFDMNNTNANNGWLQISSVLYNGSVDSGVESMISDSDSTPVYYNLQGVRVNNPEKGLYIVVKGNKASKVVF